MDGDGSRRYEQSNYSSARGYIPSRTSVPSTGASDRYRQSHVQMPTTPTSAVGSSAGSRSQGSGSFPYTQGQQQYAPPMQDGTLQYRSDYAQDAQRQQQYPNYSSNMIYSIPPPIQQQQQQQQPADYNVQQFSQQPRQSAAIEVLSNQFNVPQYYNSTEPASGTASTQQTYSSTSFQSGNQYQQSAPNRSSNSSPYTAAITDYSQMNMSNILEPSESPEHGRRTSEDAYSDYIESLKQTFRDTQQGRLVEAGTRLLRLSDWIANQASDLGLTRDEPELQQERLKFWNDFNTCWLSVLQKQKDTTQTMIDSGQPLRTGQSILQEDMLNRMGGELVRMCDGLERHGLVDYEMGVWEEEIMSILRECDDLLRGDPEDTSTADLPGILPPPSRLSR